MRGHADQGCGNTADVRIAGDAQVTAEEDIVLTQVVILMRDHPQWTIWRPAGGRDWTAIRPASSRPPAPELPTMWVHADTASELSRLMQACDEQLSGHC
jgi:hypothetical protein